MKSVSTICNKLLLGGSNSLQLRTSVLKSGCSMVSWLMEDAVRTSYVKVVNLSRLCVVMVQVTAG